MGRKQGRPWRRNPCKALTGCLRLFVNRIDQWKDVLSPQIPFLRLSENIILSVWIWLACPLSAKRNFPLHRTIQTFPRHKPGLSTLTTWKPTLDWFAPDTFYLPRSLKGFFLLNMKKKVSYLSVFFPLFILSRFRWSQLLNQKTDLHIINTH